MSYDGIQHGPHIDETDQRYVREERLGHIRLTERSGYRPHARNEPDIRPQNASRRD